MMFFGLDPSVMPTQNSFLQSNNPLHCTDHYLSILNVTVFSSYTLQVSSQSAPKFGVMLCLLQVLVSFCTTFKPDYFKGIYNKIKTTLLFWIFTKIISCSPVQSLLVFGPWHCFFLHNPLCSFSGSI